MSCLNHFNVKWFKEKIKNFRNIFFLDDHNFNGGMSDLLISVSNMLCLSLVSSKFEESFDEI